MKQKYHLVSFSGGKDSTAMLLHMMELEMQIDEVLYCDTGMEFPAMERHIKKIMNVVEDAGIKFVTLKSEKSFKYYMLEHDVKRKKPLPGNPKGYSWPESKSRWCTSILKQNLIDKYITDLKEKYEVIQYVGIAFDEKYRLDRKSNNKHEHPLVDWNWVEDDALKYCYEKGYNWEGLYEIFDRVSCWCCPLQPIKDLKGLWKNFPNLWEELTEMDNATFRNIRADYTVAELELRFKFEEKRTQHGLTNNPHTKEFRTAWKKTLELFRTGKIDLKNV